MEKETLILSLVEQLRQQPADLRAEAFVVQALAQGFSWEDCIVYYDAFFSRSHANDMVSAELAEENAYRSHLALHLSRPGFYDMLPEGMFFQPGKKENGSLSVPEMVAAYRADKAREKETRAFFRPFEQEFFFQQLLLEQEEASLLEGIKEGVMQEFFRDFWDLPAGLPPAVITSFLLLLPYAHRIAGDPGLMEHSLAALLNEKVQLLRRRSGPEQVPSYLNKALGIGELGNDTICGSEFIEDYPVLEYMIGPLRQGRVSGYTEGGTEYLLIDTFNRFFAPAEADVVITVEIDRTTAVMSFEEGKEAILGYSSVL